MKSKLFKHMSLPEMYSLDVDKDNKVYFIFFIYIQCIHFWQRHVFKEFTFHLKILLIKYGKI